MHRVVFCTSDIVLHISWFNKFKKVLYPTVMNSELTHFLNSLPGMFNLLASLGHTGRRVVLGHTLNTQTLIKTDEQQQEGFK